MSNKPALNISDETIRVIQLILMALTVGLALAIFAYVRFAQSEGYELLTDRISETPKALLMAIFPLLLGYGSTEIMGDKSREVISNIVAIAAIIVLIAVGISGEFDDTLAVIVLMALWGVAFYVVVMIDVFQTAMWKRQKQTQPSQESEPPNTN